MAYTLTQARPVLTAAELALFEQSRAEPIKHLTPAKLASAVKRTRTLRDKYRDLYRRQTVGVRTNTPSAVTGVDNERTQRKADILQEVLERYEARVERVQESGTSSTKAKSSSVSGKAATKAGADKSVKKAAAKKTPGAGKVAKGAAASADKTSPNTRAKTAKSSSTSKADKKTSTTKKDAVSAQINTLGGVMADGNVKGVAARSKAGKAPSRSSKAPSRRAPTSNNKASAPDINAPLDTLPGSKRSSPLKNDPTSIAVQAHQSSRGRRAQGKRDSR